MYEYDVIIIGAGASGLIAARELCRKNLGVCVLEARGHIGGRILTENAGNFSQPVETGAEFIHGNLKHTIALLKEYKIGYTPTAGEMWRTKNGQLTIDANYVTGFDELDKYLEALDHDMSVDAFLEKYFADKKYEQLKLAVRKFVEGFDTADTSRASTLKLKDEWLVFENEEEQYRVDGGYTKLMQAIAKEIEQLGGTIHLLAKVKEIKWVKGFAHVHNGEVESYTAPKVIITVPPGVLKAGNEETGALLFHPPIHHKIAAARHLGYGSVIKILLEFDEAFWTKQQFENHDKPPLKNMGFLFTDTDIPTWWTQAPALSPLLTGWLGGPEADAMKGLDNDAIFRKAIQSLAKVFGMEDRLLLGKLKAHKVINWTADPYTRGSYGYATVDGNKYIDILLQPEEDTLYFAGESLHKGPDSGTVEAALDSGIEVSKLVSKKL